MLLAAAALAVFAIACGDGDATTGDQATGIEGVDAVVAAVLDRDAAALIGLTEFREEPCVAPPIDGIGALECLPGQAGGTIVRAFPAAACEGYWLREGDLDQTFEQFADSALALYAVVAGPASPPADAFPAGDYRIVFSGRMFERDTGLLAVVEDGRLVSMIAGCNPPEAFLEFRGEALPLVAGPFEN